MVRTSRDRRGKHVTNTYIPGEGTDRPRPEKNYLNAEKGIWSWMTTVDHKRIGVMYLVGVLSAFLIGGMFALLVRLDAAERPRTCCSERC